jgi:uncharacterized coiled-coil DUF342 family protein
MSDTPETNAALFDAFDGQGGEVVFADFAKKLERERNSLQDQRDFCMGEIERLRKERDEAREALRLLFNYFKEWDEAADIAGLDLEGADAVQPAIKILQQMEDTNPTTKSKQVSSKLVVIKTASNL